MAKGVRSGTLRVEMPGGNGTMVGSGSEKATPLPGAYTYNDLILADEEVKKTIAAVEVAVAQRDGIQANLLQTNEAGIILTEEGAINIARRTIQRFKSPNVKA